MRPSGPHGPVRLRIYTPRTTAPVTGRVWSGCTAVASAWGASTTPGTDAIARELCARAGAVVVSVDYRLAVDGVCYPVPHDDVVAGAPVDARPRR